MEERLNKVWKLLDNKKYHLCMNYKENGEYDFYLFNYYEDSEIYYSELNKPIMTSETHTIEDLEEFAKKHYMYDLHKVHTITNLIMLWIVCILSIINIFIKFLPSGFIVLCDLILIIDCIVNHIFWNINFNKEMTLMKERFEENMKKMKEKFEDE